MARSATAVLLVFCSVIVFGVPPLSAGGWFPNGIPVCTAGGQQNRPDVASDMYGGVIIAWGDCRPNSHGVYAQSVSCNGNIRWQPSGVLLSRITSICAQAPRISSDLRGGAIVVWIETRLGEVYKTDIYAQRVDPSGAPMWADSGLAVCAAPGFQVDPRVVPDGHGGAIIIWSDDRGGTWAQRMSADGDPLWTPNGIELSLQGTAAQKDERQIVFDGAGGAIVSIPLDSGELYALRIDADGNFPWGPGGVNVSTLPNHIYESAVIADGIGGAIIAFTYLGDTSNYDVYAQKIDPAGNVCWGAAAGPVCTAVDPQYRSRLTSDGAGGAIIAWVDSRYYDTNKMDIYAQKVTSAGVPLWAPDGVVICSTGHAQDEPEIVTDLAGGAVISWVDPRGGGYDVYARRINAAGVPMWRTDGVPVCAAPDQQIFARIVPDGTGGAVLAWEDWREGAGSKDIYAHHLSGAGTLPIATLLQRSEASFDGRCINVTWSLSEIGENVSFVVERSENDAERFVEMTSAAIRREGLSFSFADAEYKPGARYWYRIDVREGEESAVLFEAGPIEVPALSTALHQNHPNPFNPSTEILYYVSGSCHVTLDVYDVGGRLVASLVNRRDEAGLHSVRWNGLDQRGAPVRSGIYFYRLRAGKDELSRRMVLLR